VHVTVVVAAFNQPEFTQALVRSATSRRHEIAIDLFLHSTDPPTMAACQALAGEPAVRYHPYGLNRGLSRTWNDGLVAAYANGTDVVVLVNDDVRFGSGDLDRLVERAGAHRDCYLVSCAGLHRRLQRRVRSHGFACCAINPLALEAIGCFDENFFPAYCEDQDYSRRARLAGLSEANCADTEVEHAGSSAILSSAEVARRNAATQARNMTYYRSKWGGDGDRERFASPWNDPAIGLRIPPERRHAPYGTAHDRADRLV
jgi:GT2 family glycosyltransferase